MTSFNESNHGDKVLLFVLIAKKQSNSGDRERYILQANCGFKN